MFARTEKPHLHVSTEIEEKDAFISDLSSEKSSSNEYSKRGDNAETKQKADFAIPGQSTEPDGGSLLNQTYGIMVPGNARERLMEQINSLVQDPDSNMFCNSHPTAENSSLELIHLDVPDDELNTELVTEKESSADDGLCESIACVDVSRGQDAHSALMDSDAVETGDVGIEDQQEPSFNSEKSSSEEDFFKDETVSLDVILEILYNLNDVCFKEKPISRWDKSSLCQWFENLEEENPGQTDRLGADEDLHSNSSIFHCEDQDDDDDDDDDDADDKRRCTKDQIRRLLKRFDDFLERKHFSTAVEFQRFLEAVERMKNTMDGESWLQFRQKQNSLQKPESAEIENAKCFNESISILCSKANNNIHRLSDKLIQWQDFNEGRAELEFELAQERRVLESVEAKVALDSCEKMRLEAEHDLKLAEEQEEAYFCKLKNLRKFNNNLMELIDHDIHVNHQNQLGILANELQYLKSSKARLRKRLGLQDPPTETEDIQISKVNHHSVYSQTDDKSEEGPSGVVGTCVPLLKLLLLLILLLMAVAFAVYLEPRWLRPVNSFRLPVPVRLRHVGTFPPV